MGIVNYENFSANHSSMKNIISEMNDTLNTTTNLLSQTLNDESKGQWAATKMQDWGPLAQRIQANLERMDNLMGAAAKGNSEYQAWEAQRSGLKVSE